MSATKKKKYSVIVIASMLTVGLAAQIASANDTEAGQDLHFQEDSHSPARVLSATSTGEDEIQTLADFQRETVGYRPSISEREKEELISRYDEIRPVVIEAFGVDNVFPRVIQYSDGAIVVTSSLEHRAGQELLDRLGEGTGLQLEHLAVPNGPTVLAEALAQIEQIIAENGIDTIAGYGVLDQQGVVSVAVRAGAGAEVAEQLAAVDPSLFVIYETSAPAGETFGNRVNDNSPW